MAKYAHISEKERMTCRYLKGIRYITLSHYWVTSLSLQHLCCCWRSLCLFCALFCTVVLSWRLVWLAETAVVLTSFMLIACNIHACCFLVFVKCSCLEVCWKRLSLELLWINFQSDKNYCKTSQLLFSSFPDILKYLFHLKRKDSLLL